MWLRKEIWHHRKMHRLTVIATAMAVFLLMSVNILSDGLLKMIKTKTGDMGLDVSLLQVRDEEMMNEYLLNDLVRKTEIEKLCRVEE